MNLIHESKVQVRLSLQLQLRQFFVSFGMEQIFDTTHFGQKNHLIFVDEIPDPSFQLRGIQIRKLYEPHLFPDASMLPIFDQYFGPQTSG